MAGDIYLLTKGKPFLIGRMLTLVILGNIIKFDIRQKVFYG
ncbi:MAG: hypothetical protein FD167_1269 [bacterium]|nr:MAG: hypothetical protein FD167_1269 [bacterium]